MQGHEGLFGEGGSARTEGRRPSADAVPGVERVPARDASAVFSSLQACLSELDGLLPSYTSAISSKSHCKPIRALDSARQIERSGSGCGAPGPTAGDSISDSSDQPPFCAGIARVGGCT